MGIVVIVQPGTGDVAEVVEPYPGVKQLVWGGTDTAVCVQVPFANWCDEASRPSQSLQTSLADLAEGLFGSSASTERGEA